jgi:hypothetical protein
MSEQNRKPSQNPSELSLSLAERLAANRRAMAADRFSAMKLGRRSRFPAKELPGAKAVHDMFDMVAPEVRTGTLAAKLTPAAVRDLIARADTLLTQPSPEGAPDDRDARRAGRSIAAKMDDMYATLERNPRLAATTVQLNIALPATLSLMEQGIAGEHVPGSAEYDGRVGELGKGVVSLTDALQLADIPPPDSEEV